MGCDGHDGGNAQRQWFAAIHPHGIEERFDEASCTGNPGRHANRQMLGNIRRHHHGDPRRPDSGHQEGGLADPADFSDVSPPEARQEDCDCGKEEEQINADDAIDQH